MPTELAGKEFDRFIATHHAVCVHFWAAWNTYDFKMKSLIDRIESEYSGRVALASVEVDEEQNQTACVSLKIPNLPFYAYFRSGTLQATEIGLLTAAELRDRLDRLADGRDVRSDTERASWRRG